MSGHGEARAYYYWFSLTGCEPVDKILREVAAAGESYHNTDCWRDERDWDEEDPRSYMERIQDAANEAAAMITGDKQNDN